MMNSDEKYWGEAMVRPLLEAYGIPLIPGQVASNSAEAVEAASSLGYPVALKIISSDILHKSDAGAIRLNLDTADEVHAAYQQILSNSLDYRKDARIEGVLVEKMSSGGTETIIGMRRDPQFGPLLMFGLGGIYVELFTDIAFRLTPLTQDAALQMIMETRAGKLLSGIRGQIPADIDAVVSVILRLAQLSVDFPNIAEIEINPLMVMTEGAMALDARAILIDA
jgi:acetyltransferase